jgi:small subunit ribosomal protein S13
VRIGGVELPNKKRIEIALTYIYGIGDSLSGEDLDRAQVDVDERSRE